MKRTDDEHPLTKNQILDKVAEKGVEVNNLKTIAADLAALKELGYDIKLDTNGTNPELVKDLIDKKLIDYVAMDVKTSLDEYHLFTNSDELIEKVRQSIELFKTNVVDYEFRMTLINEYHNEKTIKKIAQLLKGSKRFFLQQFKDSDGVPNKNLHPVDEGLANHYVEILSQDIDEVSLRGY